MADGNGRRETEAKQGRGGRGSPSRHQSWAHKADRGQNPHPCLKTKKSTSANNYFVTKMRFLDTDNYLIEVYLALEKNFQINH